MLSPACHQLELSPPFCRAKPQSCPPGQAPSPLPSSVPSSHLSPMSHRGPIAPCLHPCSSCSPSCKPHVPAVSARRGPTLCRGQKACTSTAKGCSITVQHQEQQQVCNTLVLPPLSTKVFSLLPCCSALLSLIFSHEPPIPIYKILLRRYLS